MSANGLALAGGPVVCEICSIVSNLFAARKHQTDKTVDLS